jgi:hypothetical protein
MTASNKKNVFISHIHADDDQLGKLKGLLSNKGMDVRDYSITADKPNNAKSSSYIKSGILSPRIDQCSTMLVYVSPKTRNSNWVEWEIESAYKKGKTIIGVFGQGSRDCKPPDALQKYSNAMVGWNGDKIIGAINQDYCNLDITPAAPLRKTPITRHPCG